MEVVHLAFECVARMVYVCGACAHARVVRVPQGLAYRPTEGDEVEDLLLLLADVKRRFPAVEGVCCGAILSTYQRLR